MMPGKFGAAAVIAAKSRRVDRSRANVGWCDKEPAQTAGRERVRAATTARILFFVSGSYGMNDLCLRRAELQHGVPVPRPHR